MRNRSGNGERCPMCGADATGVSIKRFVRTLASARDAVIELEGNEHRVQAEVTPEIKALMVKLELPSGGH